MAEDLDEEYDDDDAEGDGGGGGGGGGRKKLLLLILLPILLIVGGVAGAWFAGVFDRKPPPEAEAAAASGEGAAPQPAGAAGAPGASGAPGAPAGPAFYDLPEMVVDIAGQGRKRTFMKVRVSLELSSQADVPIVESVMPRIVDNFQVYLRELRIEDLQGAAGIYRLREELLLRVNSAVRPAKVNDVLFKEMLVQ
ncbi:MULTISPECIES: flagellar basal body-associated FliL family protein [unclassified Haematospirillum]|uniref:flagellar basal body-associated FliL family protein n=1 Tax=unclassified Haematospirillum TaxID=2622088 RepID=UPI00143932DA|nr:MULTISPECIES: flagellar basal body-associated FliL family protein [unclassified Haematospirillum]NKD55824.1 flagellar basal body protein FliL [Haematospirillum sp. H4890]NKD75865.1 flagellar basal body protein FliL [Haematospirillum sp. H4485]NKD87957.1 flagellar basal body protein FliL [Haematospirillum sp. 15-248]